MGCTGSKERTVPKDEPPPPAAEVCSRAEYIVQSVAPPYWQFVKKRCNSDSLREIEWQSFISTFDFLLIRDVIATSHERRKAFESVRKSHGDMPACDPTKVVDESLGSLLEAWISIADDEVRTVNRQQAAHILKQAKIYRELPQEVAEFTFADLVEAVLQWTGSTGLSKLFGSISDGKETLSPEQLSAFLSYGADTPVPIEDVKELISKRLGGAVTLLRFIMFFGNPSTNDVLDPKRALSVWQDMSQPLTRYSICTRSVSTADEVSKALVFGTRAFVLRITSVNDNHPMLSESYSLHACLTTLKIHAFKTNPLPVILYFVPDEKFTVAVQDAVAETLETVLGDSIAPGLMFRGSSMSDPKFTPLGLQNRFLIVAEQGPLKPFVGFSVADMQRHGLGVRVTNVPEGTPASRAGISRTDWLTHFNGEAIESKDMLKTRLATLTFGEEFRVRKEGITEFTGIVGASVTDDTVNVSKRFSGLLFLNLVAADVGHAAWMPWDIAEETLPNAPPSASPDGSPKIPHPHSPHDSDHFRFVPKSAIGVQDGEERERAVARADANGVQFIDTSESAAATRWARGKFADNGHCGYVLQRRNLSSRQSDNTSEFGRTHGDYEDVPHAVHLEVELLATPTTDMTLVSPTTRKPETFPKAEDRQCAVALIGTPDRKIVALSNTAEVDVDEPDGKVLLLRTTTPSGEELESALPAHLVRPGYRIVSFVNGKHGSTVFPVLCGVKRHAVYHEFSRDAQQGAPTLPKSAFIDPVPEGSLETC
jgi:hypothetical protein